MTHPNKSEDVTRYTLCWVRHYEDEFAHTFHYLSSYYISPLSKSGHVASHLPADILRVYNEEGLK